jgi:predicted hydrocarbon binding protein
MLMTDPDVIAGDLYYPNKLGRIILLAMDEILGRNAVMAVLNLTDLLHLANAYPPNTLDKGFRFDDLGRIHEAMDTMYGPRSGRGLAQRVGRACFKYGLREFGSVPGATDLTFRLLPMNVKLKTGAVAVAELFNRYTDQIVKLEETDDSIHWHIERCPVCWGRQCQSPCCHIAVGLAQEGLFWVSGGKHFMVEEVACIAKGDTSCTIRVDRHPID